jgi:hypothetical protein
VERRRRPHSIYAGTEVGDTSTAFKKEKGGGGPNKEETWQISSYERRIKIQMYTL